LPHTHPLFAAARRETILDIARSRTGWLVAFCIGLLLAALVVEQFEDVLEHHVELSFFVPLIMVGARRRRRPGGDPRASAPQARTAPSARSGAALTARPTAARALLLARATAATLAARA
jgi:cation transporter-like permease